MSEYEVGLYQIIGEMIRDKRTSKGFSLEDVAEKLQVTAKTVQRYETGERKIKINTLIELADMLEFDYNNFMADAKYRLAGNNDIPLVRDKSAYYYHNEETKKIAQEIFDNKDLKILFDASRKAKPEDLKLIIEMAKRFKGED